MVALPVRPQWAAFLFGRSHSSYDRLVIGSLTELLLTRRTCIVLLTHRTGSLRIGEPTATHAIRVPVLVSRREANHSRPREPSHLIAISMTRGLTPQRAHRVPPSVPVVLLP